MSVSGETLEAFLLRTNPSINPQTLQNSNGRLYGNCDADSIGIIHTRYHPRQPRFTFILNIFDQITNLRVNVDEEFVKSAGEFFNCVQQSPALVVLQLKFKSLAQWAGVSPFFKCIFPTVRLEKIMVDNYFTGASQDVTPYICNLLQQSELRGPGAFTDLSGGIPSISDICRETMILDIAAILPWILKSDIGSGARLNGLYSFVSPQNSSILSHSRRTRRYKVSIQILGNKGTLRNLQPELKRLLINHLWRHIVILK